MIISIQLSPSSISEARASRKSFSATFLYSFKRLGEIATLKGDTETSSEIFLRAVGCNFYGAYPSQGAGVNSETILALHALLSDGLLRDPKAGGRVRITAQLIDAGTGQALWSDRYDRMIYRRCGNSGLKLPAISLGLWHNFGGVDTFENGRAQTLIAPRGSLSQAAWHDFLFHPEQELLTGQIFSLIAPAVLVGRVTSLRRDGKAKEATMRLAATSFTCTPC